MKTKIPEKLYRYGSFKSPEYLEEILLEDKIYCSSPFDFNDPFDCRPRVIVGNTTKEIKESKKTIESILKKRTTLDRKSRREEASRLIKEIPKRGNLTEEYKQLLGTSGVYCMSKKHNNLLMWSHYGDKHRGYCLEFSTENEFFSKIKPVAYETKYPVVKIFSVDKNIWGNQSFLTKSKDWEYEKEWRLTSKNPDHINFPPSSLVGIIFGCKMRQKDIEQITKWISEREGSISMYQAVMSERDFKVMIKPINIIS